MGVWIILVALLILLFGIDYITNRDKTKIDPITVFIVLLLSLLSGFRGEMGVDLKNYIRYFENIPAFTDFLFFGESFMAYSYLEPFYSLIISIFKIFTDNYNLFLFCQSLLLLIIVVKSLKKLQAPINIGLIFYFFFSYLDHFGQQRMAIVYVLCLLATVYIIRNDLKKFLGVVVIASLIQYTAIFFLPAYWLRFVFVQKSRKWSHRFDCYTNHLYRFQFSNYIRRYNKNYNTWYRSKVNLINIIVLLVFLFAFVLQFNIAEMLYKNIELFTFGNPAGNIYATKFISYYEEMTGDKNILNAWFGILSNVAVMVFLYIYRNRWLDLKTAPIFTNYSVGLLLFVLVYQIPKLGDRLFQMYAISAFVVLFSIIAAQKKRPLNVLPLILFILLYEFVQNIANETGPYVLIGSSSF